MVHWIEAKIITFKSKSFNLFYVFKFLFLCGFFQEHTYKDPITQLKSYRLLKTITSGASNGTNMFKDWWYENQIGRKCQLNETSYSFLPMQV